MDSRRASDDSGAQHRTLTSNAARLIQLTFIRTLRPSADSAVPHNSNPGNYSPNISLRACDRRRFGAPGAGRQRDGGKWQQRSGQGRDPSVGMTSRIQGPRERPCEVKDQQCKSYPPMAAPAPASHRWCCRGAPRAHPAGSACQPRWRRQKAPPRINHTHTPPLVCAWRAPARRSGNQVAPDASLRKIFAGGQFHTRKPPQAAASTSARPHPAVRTRCGQPRPARRTNIASRPLAIDAVHG
jgi:hypothetical protein